jgi:hypothetical protein
MEDSADEEEASRLAEIMVFVSFFSGARHQVAHRDFVKETYYALLEVKETYRSERDLL